MSEHIGEYTLIILGSLIIAGGGTLAGLYAIKGSYLGVFIGYISFVFGYKTCWLGEHKPSKLIEYTQNTFKIQTWRNLYSEITNHFLALIGIFLISVGTTLFAQIIIGESNLNAGISGIITFGGYMVAHKGVNGVLV